MNILTSPDNSHGRIAAVGMFDGVHNGHKALLASLTDHARQLGLSPTVVTFRNHPRELTASQNIRLLTGLDERLSLLSSQGVSEVILLDFDSRLRMLSAEQFMTMLSHDYDVKALVIGFNNRFGHDRPDSIEQYRQLGSLIGMEVFAADRFSSAATDNVSSSTVREMLRQGNVKDASTLLGHNYSITGTVEHGKALGRTIGFPTANLRPDDPRRVIPANGVYAVSVILPDGKKLPGMLNIGHRPTVDSPDAPPSIEVHIINFDGNLYDQEITVEFISFMRKEQAFASIGLLQQQLIKDAAEASRLAGA